MAGEKNSLKLEKSELFSNLDENTAYIDSKPLNSSNLNNAELKIKFNKENISDFFQVLFKAAGQGKDICIIKDEDLFENDKQHNLLETKNKTAEELIGSGILFGNAGDKNTPGYYYNNSAICADLKDNEKRGTVAFYFAVLDAILEQEQKDRANLLNGIINTIDTSNDYKKPEEYGDYLADLKKFKDAFEKGLKAKPDNTATMKNGKAGKTEIFPRDLKGKIKDAVNKVIEELKKTDPNVKGEFKKIGNEDAHVIKYTNKDKQKIEIITKANSVSANGQLTEEDFKALLMQGLKLFGNDPTLQIEFDPSKIKRADGNVADKQYVDEKLQEVASQLNIKLDDKTIEITPKGTEKKQEKTAEQEKKKQDKKEEKQEEKDEELKRNKKNGKTGGS